uniref:Uncharacterized protein n=1 Tax=viral metagenome TaxID=1070528 RepID=A0A6C0EE96_9ZZZZ
MERIKKREVFLLLLIIITFNNIYNSTLVKTVFFKVYFVIILL